MLTCSHTFFTWLAKLDTLVSVNKAAATSTSMTLCSGRRPVPVVSASDRKMKVSSQCFKSKLIAKVMRNQRRNRFDLRFTFVRRCRS